MCACVCRRLDLELHSKFRQDNWRQYNQITQHTLENLNEQNRLVSQQIQDLNKRRKYAQVTSAQTMQELTQELNSLRDRNELLAFENATKRQRQQ